ncbi:MAG: ATP-dependent DNA helicase [Pseudomonadota bacterium]
MSKEKDIAALTASILGPEGRLAREWPGYEPRPGQLEMALEAARAFADDDIALVEAGTGTGKTLAYLIPALLSGKKTIASTGTKNLQEQIFHKDIPFIRKALKADFRAAYLKGRENYLCLHRFRNFLQEPFFEAVHEAVFLDRLKAWADNTETGDRAELTDLPESFVAWSDLTSSGDRCLGRNCPEREDCFLQRARRKAAAADLVVVNHHLFMADLAIREERYSEVIPEYQAVVFDEAHLLEDVATQHFGIEVSTWRLARLRRDLEKELGAKKILNPDFGGVLEGLKNLTDVLGRDFFPQPGEYDLWGENDPDLMNRLSELGRRILAFLGTLTVRLEKAGEKDEDVLNLAKRAARAAGDLADLLEARSADFVYWAERRGRGLHLHASPIDVSSFLQEKLYKQDVSLVFTSATLTSDNSFAFFKKRMGLPPELDGLIVDSPFDYQNQTLLWVPGRLPPPQSPSYLDALTEEVERLLHLSRGRAFVLFTSFRNMHYVSSRLRARLPWTCLIHGEAPRNALLEQFRRETDSVLMGSHSFWQGVDVPGESLSAVIIDKLPFPRPDSPLVRARSNRLQEEGGDPFYDYSIPEAVITLKQGLGRLIRGKTDRGLLAVLDSRLMTKGYGRRFLKSIPYTRLTKDLEEIRKFFAGGSEGSDQAPKTMRRPGRTSKGGK